MKQYLREVVFCCVFVILLCSLPKFLMAQPLDPGDPANDPDLPIDGGISLLVAAGAAYGIKKIRDERKNKVNKLP